MEASLICSSLTKRSDWAALARSFLQSKAAKWKVASLETHDVAIPLPLAGPRAMLRALFLTASDVGKDQTRTRIERLFNLNGGQHVAVVLLMKPHDGRSSSAVLMKLQLELVGGLEMPIIPVLSIENVEKSLLDFHRQICTGTSSQKRVDAARDVLPHCSQSQTLSPHSVNVLTDITLSLKNLVETISTVEGQQKLAEYLGVEEASGLVNFWVEDYAID